MRLLGVICFFVGMFTFASGLIFLDLASMALKEDIYTINILAHWNNLFSLNEPTAMFQSILSLIFILLGWYEHSVQVATKSAHLHQQPFHLRVSFLTSLYEAM